MTTFQYRAVTSNDRSEVGTIDAENGTAATRRLIDRGLYPIELTTSARSLSQILAAPVYRTSLSVTQMAQLLADLGHLVNAGVEIVPALAIVAATGERHVTDTLGKLLEKVRVGGSLSDAMGTLGTAFPTHVVAVVRAGELSGSVGAALLRASDSQRRAASLRSRIRTALIYPTCVAIAVCIAILVLVGIVVPTLEGLFANELQRLPWQTRLLVAVGRLVHDHALLLVSATAVVVGAAVISYKHPRSRRRLELVALRLPAVGRILVAAETARFAMALATLSSAGIPLANAVALSALSTRLALSADGMLVATRKLREGFKLHEALSEAPTLGERALSLIRIGETTARLGPLLEEAARDAELQVSIAIDRSLALLTPAMTLVFGAVAGFVLYAVMTSILSINDLTVTGL